MMPRHQKLTNSIFFLLFTVIPAFISAQTNPGYEHITTAQGLSQGLINDMIQDKEGFIWIATKGGLNRYDGYSFKIFTADPSDSNSISSNAISSLLEDRAGRIWIATADGGVNVYDKKSGNFLHLNRTDGLSSNRIESPLVELWDGRILINPEGGELNLVSFPEKGKPVISTLSMPEGRRASWLFKDEKGFIWLSCLDKYIYVLDEKSVGMELLFDGVSFTSVINKTGKFISAKFSQGLPSEEIPDILLEYIDSIGALTPGLIQHINDDLMLIDNRFPVRIGSSGCNFLDLTQIKPGDGLGEITSRNIKMDVRDQNAKCLLFDRSGGLWVGTMGHGIYKYKIRSDRFNFVLPKNSIQRITVWKNDILYIQNWDDNITINQYGEKLKSLAPSITSSAGAYTTVIQSRKGDYWSYWNKAKALFQYNADGKLITRYADPVNNIETEHLQPLMEDSRGRVWLCGSNGSIASVDPSTGAFKKFVINITQYTGTSSTTQTNAFYEDSRGVFWLGTEHGFARLVFNDNAAVPDVTWFKNIPGDDNSLSYNYVSWFIDDPQDANLLWICTKGGGINQMDKISGKFIRYTSKQGLPNDVVYGLQSDNDGNLWGSTNRGLFCMLRNSEGGKPVFRNFTTSDGLQSDEFNTNALAKISNGHLLFGGVNGINIFDPQRILKGNFTPHVFITGIQIGSKVVSPGDNTKVLKETIEQAASITLTHLQNVLTLEFSSLDFTAPWQNKYRYQLIGIDKDWVESGTRRNATYLHLPAGTYVFKVQGTNSQGIWSEHIAQLEIKVLPPWWRSWWAYLIYALLVMVAIRTWLQFNINRAKLRAQLSFEQLEAKRVKELDTIKTQLYTNITHEFRTPLTVILGMAQQVKENPQEQFEQRMNMITRNGKNLLNLVNELLDLSKLETGKMQLHLSKNDVVAFLRYVVESFQSLSKSQQKQLHFLAEIDSSYIEFDQEKLRQIVSNLLSNAIKFTPEQGNIYITVTETSPDMTPAMSMLVIKVKDTGIGIPEDQLPHIFDRFYQSDNSHTRNAEGTGIGLALTRELVKLMQGEITVKSPPTGATKGSEFTVRLPLKKVDALSAEMAIDYHEVSEASAKWVAPDAKPDFIPTNNEADAPLLLLVEDNADVVAYTASCLSGYRLAVGRDGREGLEIAKNIIPDLIVTDVMMPFIDGFEMVSQLHKHELTSHIPVIMLTAKADLQSRIEGLQTGAEAYLEKPFHKEELLVRIQKLLEKRKQLQHYYLLKAGMNEVAAVTVEDLPAAPAQVTQQAERENEFVKKVREVIEQNLTDTNFSVEKLCRLVYASHSQLHRKLDALTGCSPNKFIRMIRLKKAKELLADPANSIGSISLDCGYADPGYFARVFKQEFGLSPQQWREG